MNKATTFLTIGTAAVVAGGLFVVLRSPVAGPKPKGTSLPVPSTSKPKELEAFVAMHAADKRPEVQDRVGAARIRLGYSLARTEGYAKARTAFLATAETHKGTGTQSAAFGGVADQAAYQAAACLVGEGKNAEATKEFERFLKERPLSPLATASYRRLQRLNGGESKPEWDLLLQADISRQEAHIRFETSVCGPKCLEHLTGKDYKEIAKLCGTTDNGTTVEGMRKGLKALGKESWAVKLNRADLAKAALPAVLLEDDHYVIVEKIEGDTAALWDPRYRSSRPWKLPKIDDPDFSATVILLSKPEGL